VSRRSSRILRRLAVVVLLLAVVGLAAFTWIAYWPLEGSVGDVTRLIPEDVDFVYVGRYGELESNAWVRANLLDHPVIPAFADLKKTVEDGVTRSIRQQLEDPINASIPFGVTRFSVEKDVFPGRTVVCGRFCEGWGPERGKPLHPKEWLVLTEATWKVRFLSALKHGFVRKRIPRVSIEVVEPGVWLFDVPGIAVSKPEQRSGCGEGFVIPPENLVYAVRVKNVLALSNSKALALSVAELGRAGEEARSFADRPDFSLKPPPGGIAAAMDLRPLHGYLIRLLESASGSTTPSMQGEVEARPAGGPLAGLVNRFLTVKALGKLNGVVETPSQDLLKASASVLYEQSELAPGVRDVYASPPADLRGGIARLVPAADTFGVLLLQSPPLHLMQSVWEEALTAGQRDLVLQNLKNKGTYQSMDEFFRELSDRLGSRGAIAIARISDVFDRANYPDWYSDPTDNPDPFPAFALLVTLRQTATPQEVDEFLAKSMPALGFKSEIRRVEYRGLTYSKLEIEQKTADYALATPAYMLHQETLILANNEDYFRRIVDTLGGAAAPLSEDPTYQATMAVLPAQAQLGLFLDLSKILRVPPDAEPGSQPRGFAWDHRNLWVIRNHDTREEAIRYRRELQQRFHEQRRTPSPQEQVEIERQVDEHVTDWQRRYPQFLETYRQNLLGYRRLRSFGAAFVTTRDAVTADFALLAQPVGETKP
jgi:hypothetical protein